MILKHYWINLWLTEDFKKMMTKISMVDLHGQYEAIKSEVDAAIAACLQSTAFINGPQVATFEEELATYLAAKHLISCANGTDALQIALMALNLQAGDEVIVPAFTYVATAEVIALLKLVPVWVEADPLTFNMNPQHIEKAIGPKTKAIIPVHLYGQCADMESVLAIAEKHNLFVIEDNAQAIGADYTFKNGVTKKAGTMGHIGCTSFFPSKNLGCYGDGGALYTNDDLLGSRIRKIANHGQAKKYYHELVGVNSRLDTIQAAILSIKLKNLDEYIARRNKAANFYDEALKNVPGITIPKRLSSSTHVFHQYTLIVEKSRRDILKDDLQKKGIPTMVYYPVPLHLQEAYKNEKYPEGTFPVAEQLSKSVLSLPMHTELTEEQLKYITEGVIESVTHLQYV